jgi:hypothetical protein
MKPQHFSAPSTASASFPFSADFLPVALEFTEKAARGFAFGEREIGGLVLAVEEIFTFYLEQLTGTTGIDLLLENEHYQLVLTLTFRMANPELRAFNLTYRVDPDDEASLAGLGPMIAARSVTRLRLALGKSEQVSLQLTREREYAPAVATALPTLDAHTALRLYEPTREDTKHFGCLLATCNNAFVPSFLARPGMAADMLACGAIGALLANRGDAMVGGLLWRRLSASTVELFGPYLLYADAQDEVLTRLLDEAVGLVSRTGARALMRRQGPLLGFERFFDFLGELTLAESTTKASDNAGSVCTYYYRQLREESGGTVYAEARFAGFLRTAYERLSLPRRVRETSLQGEESIVGQGGASVLSVDFESHHALATLRLLATGRDLADNLAAHLILLEHKRMRNVIVEIDTGCNDSTAFAPVLYDAGFLPRLLLPEAGKGDLVLFSR